MERKIKRQAKIDTTRVNDTPQPNKCHITSVQQPASLFLNTGNQTINFSSHHLKQLKQEDRLLIYNIIRATINDEEEEALSLIANLSTEAEACFDATPEGEFRAFFLEMEGTRATNTHSTTAKDNESRPTGRFPQATQGPFLDNGMKAPLNKEKTEEYVATADNFALHADDKDLGEFGQELPEDGMRRKQPSQNWTSNEKEVTLAMRDEMGLSLVAPKPATETINPPKHNDSTPRMTIHRPPPSTPNIIQTTLDSCLFKEESNRQIVPPTQNTTIVNLNNTNLHMKLSLDHRRRGKFFVCHVNTWPDYMQSFVEGLPGRFRMRKGRKRKQEKFYISHFQYHQVYLEKFAGSWMRTDTLTLQHPKKTAHHPPCAYDLSNARERSEKCTHKPDLNMHGEVDTREPIAALEPHSSKKTSYKQEDEYQKMNHPTGNHKWVPDSGIPIKKANKLNSNVKKLKKIMVCHTANTALGMRNSIEKRRHCIDDIRLWKVRIEDNNQHQDRENQKMERTDESLGRAEPLKDTASNSSRMGKTPTKPLQVQKLMTPRNFQVQTRNESKINPVTGTNKIHTKPSLRKHSKHQHQCLEITPSDDSTKNETIVESQPFNDVNEKTVKKDLVIGCVVTTRFGSQGTRVRHVNHKQKRTPLRQLQNIWHTAIPEIKSKKKGKTNPEAKFHTDWQIIYPPIINKMGSLKWRERNQDRNSCINDFYFTPATHPRPPEEANVC